MEENIQGLAGSRINLMALIVSMPVGGVETQLLSVLRRLNKDRYNVMLCCIKDPGELGQKTAKLGIKTISLNLMKSSRFSLDIPGKIAGTIRENNIHILWTHQYVANLYGRLASRYVKIPVVVPTFHVLYDKPKFHRRILNHLLSYQTDMMVSVSKAVADDMVRFDRVDRKKITVIYNGVDTGRFDCALSKNEAQSILGLPSGYLMIGSVGNLREQKGQRHLIEAASGMEHTTVAIAGEGHLKDKLKDLADRKKVNCIFTGMLEPEKIPVFLKALDIFCFPSLWEGFGVAVVEAMASGLPVIASDISPHREVIDNAGMYVPPGNTAALAKALRVMAGDASLRKSLAQAAKERAQLFSIDNTVRAYEGLFESMLRNN